MNSAQQTERTTNLRAAERARCGLVALLCLVAGSCGSIPFLGGDSSLPRDRATRFDRFSSELLLELADTAAPHERLAIEVQVASALGEVPELGVPAWDAARRAEARRGVLAGALTRLEDQFAPSRFSGVRESTARIVERDLKRALGLDDDTSFNGAAPADLVGSGRSRPMTPWRGDLLVAPSILAREQPTRSSADVERWFGELERIADTPLDLSDVTPRVYLDAFGPRAAQVANAVREDLARLAASVGTGDVGDAFAGPLADAARGLPAPQADRFAGRSQRRLLRALESRVAARLTAVQTLQRQLDGQRGQRTVAPLVGEARDAWLRRLRDAAGSDAEVDGLDRLARDEIDRLRRRLAETLGVEQPADDSAVRAAFDAVRAGDREVPGASTPPRAPEAVWALCEGSLDTWIDDPPQTRLVVRRARTFERPHGRWSPFVRGDLAPPTDPAAMPSVYLAPRPRDPTVPLWLHEAEALRYGVPGAALLDGFRRAATDRALYVRVIPREAFTAGWSLYAACSVVEEGLVDLGDQGFGTTAQELCAYVALGVDIGLHERGWSYAQALDAVLAWTPLPEFAAREFVLRSLCDPGRPSLSGIGLLRLRALREAIEQLLDEDFALAPFHAAILEGGPVPMSELDARVKRWLDARGDGDR